jgi:adenylylsulfate kinase
MLRRNAARLLLASSRAWTAAAAQQHQCCAAAAAAAPAVLAAAAARPFSAAAGSDDSKQQKGHTRPFTAYDVGASTNIKWHEGGVPLNRKERLLGQKGTVLWFTGLSGSGKSTVACTLEHALVARGHATALLDGDNVRHGLNKNLGFTAADREENIRRIGEVGKLFADAGLLALVSFISPYRADRDKARSLLPKGKFVEVYMRVPIEVCETRDPKGLYKKARAGLIKGFTGIDDPYEEPQGAEIVLDAVDSATGEMVSPQDQARAILEYLEKNGHLEAPAAEAEEESG